MLRPVLVSALTIASFIPLASAQEGLVPVTPAIYHPGLDRQSTVVKVDYSYRARRRRACYRRRHWHHEAVNRIGLEAAAGAGAGAVYNKHEENKHRQ